MASSRLLFDSVTLYSDSYSTELATINNITVDGLEISKEANTVEIENGLTLNESFTGSITIRTISTQTTEDAPPDILGGATLADYISSDGSVPTDVYMQLNHTGGTGNFDVRMGPVYLMGHEDFSNNRVETVLYATKESAAQTVIQENAIS
jgi:hypothetical protein